MEKTNRGIKITSIVLLSFILFTVIYYLYTIFYSIFTILSMLEKELAKETLSTMFKPINYISLVAGIIISIILIYLIIQKSVHFCDTEPKLKSFVFTLISFSLSILICVSNATLFYAMFGLLLYIYSYTIIEIIYISVYAHKNDLTFFQSLTSTNENKHFYDDYIEPVRRTFHKRTKESDNSSKSQATAAIISSIIIVLSVILMTVLIVVALK